MDATLVDDLIASGDLAREWRDAFIALPRERFLPDIVWDWARNYWEPVHRETQPERWLELARGTEFVVTQVDDGHPAGPGHAGVVPTSSASMPKMVARMLQYLDIYGGERVLEIGTGTGWNAALLAYRLGADRVTTIEIDPRIAAHAHARLAAAGYGDVVNLAGNGSLGHAAMAPYHRVISTAACQQVPYAWVRQSCPGGRIVTPWGTPWCNFGLLSLTVGEDGTAMGQLVDTANFMWLRDQRIRWEPIRPTDEDEALAQVSWTDLHPADVRHVERARGAMIAIGVLVPDCRSSYTTPAGDPDGDGVLWLADHTTNSWARLEHKPGAPGPYKVVQFGPRRLWDEVEAAHRWWVDQGRPGAERWLFTVAPQGQQIELA